MKEDSSSEESGRALVPVEEKQVEFYGDELTAVLVEEGDEKTVYVPIRPLCEFMGVAFGSQRNRIRRDPVLSSEVRIVFITNTNPSGGNPNVLCLPLKFLPGWLFGLSPQRVRPELREKIIRYQRECYDVLFEAFAGRVVPTDASPNAAALVQIRETALAIAELAQQQLEIDQRLTGRLDRAAAVVGELGKRVRALEAQLSPAGALTDGQAADIKSKVAGLARTLAEGGPVKDYYQSIYTELNRRFRSTSYKTIRQADYQAVLDFLDTWHESVRPKG